MITSINMERLSNHENQEEYVPNQRQFVERSFRRWTREENFKYVQFLNQYESSFQSERVRRTSKVFKRLSNFIGTKTQSQCKSHHQKMINIHKSIEQITKYFEDKYGCDSQDNTSISQNKGPIFEPVSIVAMPLIEFESPIMEEESIFDVLIKFDNQSLLF